MPWAARRRSPGEIIEAQADYLLAVKENQGRLYQDVRDLFEGAEEYDFEGVSYDFARTLNKGHGRLETRQCWVITDPDCLDYLQNRQQWANLNAVAKVTAQRETATETTVHSRYYISSLAGPAKSLLEATRRHWGIENSWHWSLDVTFREDHSRVRKDHGPQNLAVLRQIAQVQEKMNAFFDGLTHRKDEVRHRCRTLLQARADALMFTPAVPLPSLQNVVPTLALV